MSRVERHHLIAVAVALMSACGLGAPSALATAEGPEAPPPTINGVALSGATPESLGLPFPRSATPSPEEAAADAQSRTRFGSLNRDAAVSLAKQTFAVDRPSWTPPGAEQGASISRYLGPHSALETLPGGKHVVVGSSIPLRTEGSTPEPVSMALHEVGESYVPANPLVPVAISKHVSQGLSFPAGISVAPASAEASEGPQTVGNDVVFANSAPDTDFLAEPVPQGAEVSWQLRSQQSPEDNALNFNLPPGASLRSSTTLAGGVEVIEEGQTVMAIPPALALQADGRSLPTSYTISGNTLTTHVDLSGTVDFPVMLDPILVGAYGTANGANVWSGWHHADSCGGCFEALEFYNLIQIGANPPPAENNFGDWYIYAPGAGNPGGAGITRVDLSGVIHQAENQSVIEAGIEKSTGGSPVYSLNGLAGATGPSPLATWTAYSNQAMAFCAQGAGGHDGGEQPLCDENYSGQDFSIFDVLGSGRTVFNYIRVGGAQITYLDTTPPNSVEWLLGGGTVWNQHGPTNDYISATDQGLGIQRYEIQLPPGHPYTFRQEISCNQPNGFVGCPQSERSQNINLAGLETGIYEVGAVAVDAAGNATLQKPYPKLYIDHTPPSTPVLSGPLAEAANTTIGNGNYALKFSSEDGSPTSPQSGVQALEVRVDGRKAFNKATSCPAPIGIPSSECFGLSGEWTMNGQTYGGGSHVVSVIAYDWTGNSTTKTLNVTVNEAGGEPVGPGSVNLETGDYKLSATDVSISAANATLSLSRTYDSRNLSQGASGPLGPQWALSLPDTASSGWQSLTPLEGGRVSVYTAGGVQLIFAPNGSGGWTSPAEYQADTLSEPATGVYQITDANGNYTKFTQPASGTSFLPSTVGQASGAGGLNKVAYSFTRTAGGIIEPTKILAPEPSEGACTSTLVKGCRELTFNYATSTTATGEAQSEWGDYIGRLTRVYFTAWDPAQNKMSEPITVAQYAYDKQGRLRAEWDPRVTPNPLKTTYGYDPEGHVSALTPAGQQTWAFHYGAIPGDPSEGRLLSVARPSASGELWNGQVLKNTAAPTLSGSAKVGIKMTVAHGTWSANPVSYAYQWMQCNSSGVGCVAILGATNPSYVPASGDVGHKLDVQVSATNAGGTVTALTAVSALVETGSGTEGAPPPAPEARSTIEYRVPTSGTGLPTLTASAVKAWVQTDVPTEATAIFPPDEPQSWPASNYERANLYYLDERSRTVNVASPTGGISTTEYDGYDNVIRTLSPDNRASALKAEELSKVTAERDSTYNFYSADGTELESTVGPQHYTKILATEAKTYEHKRTRYYYDEGAPAGGPYRLVTKTTESAGIGTEEKDIRTTQTSYSGQEGLGWKLHAATSTTGDPGGLNLTHKTAYDPQTGNVTEDISPGGAVHDTRTIYYSTGPNSEFKSCGEHAEWAGLPCRAQPAQQPAAKGLPNLPETTYTYNIWDEPTVTTDTVGTTTRTTTIGYDTAGRVQSSAISSSVDTPVPTVTDKYSEATGALIEQSANSKTIKSKFNTLGQLESYTDADGNESTYAYDVDGRAEKVSDGKGTQTYAYDPTTGLLTSLKDSALKESAMGGFTASYDVEGNLTSEEYPNGMSANYTYDQTGRPIELSYEKTTNCTTKCTWYSDSIVPTIHNQWITQQSILSRENYAYDRVGRLTEVGETPGGKGCTTRLYALDENGNRTGLTTRAPGAENKCATEGGTVEHHLYDEANRLVDEGVTYDTFGNTTALPSADAGGSPLTSSYYVSDALASQTQNGETISYGLDPARRTRETVSTGTSSSTIVSHFSGGGDSPAWEVDSGGKWTRYIKGINGSLAAIQVNGATPVLELPNLHGDIVATAALSETETKLLTKAETTEFGVPKVSSPSKYSWLGADQRSTELPTGVIAMGARSYIPQLGRFEQTDPQPGGSANPYAYSTGDPVNSSDPSGEFTSTITYNEEAAQSGPAAEGLSEHYVVAGAVMPPPVNLQIEQEFNANPPWDAAAVLNEAEPEEGEGGRSTPRRFRNLEYPGLPAGAQCEGAVNSKRYKKEHPKLCHELEHQNPWEPLEAICAISPLAGVCNGVEKAKTVKRVGN